MSERYPAPAICPKCKTRVCMKWACNPPPPATEEAWLESIASCTARKLEREELLARLQREVTYTEDRAEAAEKAGITHEAASERVRAEVQWQGVIRIQEQVRNLTVNEYKLKQRIWPFYVAG